MMAVHIFMMATVLAPTTALLQDRDSSFDYYVAGTTRKCKVVMASDGYTSYSEESTASTGSTSDKKNGKQWESTMTGMCTWFKTNVKTPWECELTVEWGYLWGYTGFCKSEGRYVGSPFKNDDYCETFCNAAFAQCSKPLSLDRNTWSTQCTKDCTDYCDCVINSKHVQTDWENMYTKDACYPPPVKVAAKLMEKKYMLLKAQLGDETVGNLKEYKKLTKDEIEELDKQFDKQ